MKATVKIEIDFIQDPTVKLSPAQRRRVIVAKLYERMIEKFVGQQTMLSIDEIKMTIEDAKGISTWTG